MFNRSAFKHHLSIGTDNQLPYDHGDILVLWYPVLCATFHVHLSNDDLLNNNDDRYELFIWPKHKLSYHDRLLVQLCYHNLHNTSIDPNWWYHDLNVQLYISRHDMLSNHGVYDELFFRSIDILPECYNLDDNVRKHYLLHSPSDHKL